MDITYSRQEDGRYLVSIFLPRGKVYKKLINKLPPHLTGLTPPTDNTVRQYVPLGDPTVFDLVGEELFKAGCNTMEVERLCKLIKRRTGRR